MTNEITRKDLLLLLLYVPGPKGDFAEPIDGRTRLMKLLFLLQSEFPLDKLIGSKNGYNFVPYHYGPFAKDVYDDLDFLENVGLVRVAFKGDANSVDQNEQEKLVDDTTIGLGGEETNLIFPEERYQLTDQGRHFVEDKLLQIVPENLKLTIKELKSNFAALPLNSLLRYVYDKYPASAKNSVLKHLISSQ